MLEYHVTQHCFVVSVSLVHWIIFALRKLALEAPEVANVYVRRKRRALSDIWMSSRDLHRELFRKYGRAFSTVQLTGLPCATGSCNRS
jgi:hypothetical protein